MFGFKKVYRLIEDLLEVEKCNQRDIAEIKAILNGKPQPKQADLSKKYADYMNENGLLGRNKVKSIKENTEV